MTDLQDGADPQDGPVVVVGAGTIGAGWAAFFALSGLEVRVVDPNPAAAATVSATLERARPVMAALERLSNRPTTPAVFDTLGRTLDGATHVQEALPEDLALKHRVYAQIEALAAPDLVIASSSSGLLPSALQQGLKHPQRMLVVHPNNPPYLMPLIEIVAGPRTDPAVVAATRAFYEALGKQTIVLRREITGHLFNRLQAALWREAIHLVAEGYASAADVDRAVTEGLGARWAVCGPLEILHLAGGEDGIAGAVDRLGPALTSWWRDLGQPTLDAATRQALVDGMDEALQGQSYAERAARRDRLVVPLMASLAPPKSGGP